MSQEGNQAGNDPGNLDRGSAGAATPAVAPDRPLAVEVGARVALAAAVLAALVFAAPALGAQVTPAIALTWLAGIAGVTAFPRQAYLIAGVTGLAVLWQWTAMRTFGYHVLLIGATFAVRRWPRVLVVLLFVAIIVIPKELFRRHYHQPFLHDWVNPFLLAHLFLMVLVWLSAAQRGRATEPGFAAWLSLLMFPSHPINPMTFSPSDLWQARTARARDAVHSLGVLLLKAATLAALAWTFPRGQLAQQGAAELLAAGPLSLWRSVAHSYLVCALTLSGTADLAVVVARLFGWPLAHPFRWALLAWNPVELWRRWAIYNRKVLLTLVYFPLGGGQHRRTLNVMLTFAASGLILHSGWLGSRYWETGIGGWRDQTLYFLMQGFAVSACLLYWRWRGKDPASDRQLRWSWDRVLAALATQALSAWLHILVLAPGTLSERFALMARCFGL